MNDWHMWPAASITPQLHVPCPFLSPLTFFFPLPRHLPFPFSSPFSSPFSFPFPPKSWGALWASPAGSGAEPQSKLNFMHLKWKIWHLVGIILVTFTKNYIDFPPVSGKTLPLIFFGAFVPMFIQCKTPLSVADIVIVRCSSQQASLSAQLQHLQPLQHWCPTSQR